MTSPNAAPALFQAAIFGRWWFIPIIAAAFLGLAVHVLFSGRKLSQASAARAMTAIGALGFFLILAQGAAIGPGGWSYAALSDAFGPLGQKQFGVGAGMAVTTIGFLTLFTTGLAGQGGFRSDPFTAFAVGLIALLIVSFTAWPVGRMLVMALSPTPGQNAIEALANRLLEPKIWGLACLYSGKSCGVAWNTVALALSTALAATMLGLCFALLVTRTSFPAKKLMRALTILPIITPSFVIGLGLILIFGRSGIVNQGIEQLFGLDLGRWIYGFQGVWLAQVFCFTPTAFLVLIGVVEGVSPTLEEAAGTLRADRWTTFWRVSLPLMRPGVANAFLVVFVESIADFGNPILLGGSLGLLSTEVYFAVVGAQANFSQAAALALLLLLLAFGAFYLQRKILGRYSYVSMSGKGDAGLGQPLPDRVRRFVYGVTLPWTVLTVGVYGMALVGGFVKVWGRDWSPTLSHYSRAFSLEWGPSGVLWSGSAWNSFFTTIQLAAISAPVTAAIGILTAWLLTRQRFAGRTALEFALMLSFAVPGTVLGVSYILAFNVPPLELTGTAVILVLCFTFRNMPVGVRAGMAAMSQIDKSLDEAAMVLRASAARTMTNVLLPLLRPAMVTALIYSFVRSITTVSAVIFLTSAEHEMATVFIINRVINGDYGVAIAYCSVLIVMMMVALGTIQLLVGRRNLGRRTAGAKAPAPAHA
ncbi:ABC transporter permease [Alsobacter soli]|nr:iron ABC transporter permease [Alsobacter soli]